jgi:hypothetical protein
VGPYCPTCGQRDTAPNPTLSELCHEAMAELAHWDSKVPATLVALLGQPGRLTQEFLAGRRARWLSPLKVYLICSIAYFASGPVVERVTGHGARAIAQLKVTGDSTERAMLVDSAAFVNDPEIRANAFVRYIGAAQAWKLVNNPGTLKDIIAAAVPKAMFVLLPVFALLTWIAWRSTGLRFPAHLVFALHLHAAFFAAALVPVLLEPVGRVALDLAAQIGLIAYGTWYAIVACQRALGGNAWQVTVRTTVVALAYTPFALVLVMGASALAIRAL